MSDFGMSLAVLFGGVFGGAVGFLILALAALAIALPFLLMNRRRDAPSGPDEDQSKRYH